MFAHPLRTVVLVGTGSLGTPRAHQDDLPPSWHARRGRRRGFSSGINQPGEPLRAGRALRRHLSKDSPPTLSWFFKVTPQGTLLPRGHGLGSSSQIPSP